MKKRMMAALLAAVLALSALVGACGGERLIPRVMRLYNANCNAALSEDQTTIDYRKPPQNLRKPIDLTDDFYDRQN